MGVGGLVCLLGIAISLIPTDEAAGMPTPVYVAVLVLGTLVFSALPFLLWVFRKPSWYANETGDVDSEALSLDVVPLEP